MKHILVAIMSVCLFSSFCFAAETAQPKNQKDKESYSLGYQFGQSLKTQNLDINIDVYTSGIKDALGGKKPALSQEDIKKVVSEIQTRVAAVRQKELKEKAEKNLAASKAFMEANKKKEGVVALPSGLQYKVLKEGKGKAPKSADEVTIGYTASYINGTEFHSTYKKGLPMTVRIDKVIPGWKEALLLMKEGSKWQLFVPPELAYGDRTAGVIPPNSALVFEMELVSVKEAEKGDKK